MDRCLKDLEKNRKQSVDRMKDTMKDFQDNLTGAENKMLRLLREVRSRVHDDLLGGTGRHDTPPRAAATPKAPPASLQPAAAVASVTTGGSSGGRGSTGGPPPAGAGDARRS
eukprot:11269334-Karenia_brevis.AAC.1